MENFIENGKFVGMFRTNDRVIYTPANGLHGPLECYVSYCFGWSHGAYAYVVNYTNDSFAHVREYELQHLS